MTEKHCQNCGRVRGNISSVGIYRGSSPGECLAHIALERNGHGDCQRAEIRALRIKVRMLEEALADKGAA